MPRYATSTLPADLATERPAFAATPPQISFIVSLLAEREIPESARQIFNAKITSWTNGDYDNGISKRRASEFIERLKEAPKKATAVPAASTDFPDVAAGRYAVREDDGVTRFYKVDRPTEGRWAGRVFVSIQASDDLHPIRDRARRTAILKAINADVIGALRLYGQEIGSCGHCGRTLTDETSREFGIGPVCRRHLGI